MSPRPTLATILLLPPLLALVLLLGCGDGEDSGTDPGPAGDPSTTSPHATDGPEVELYFPTADGRLVTVRRRVTPREDPVERVRVLAEAILGGPRDGEAGVRPLPVDIRLGDVYLAGGGVVYVDLRTDRAEDPPAAGGEDAGDPTDETPKSPEEEASAPAAAPMEPPPVGSTAERQIVYSLVNTLALNSPAVDRVVILWNGRQRPTFAGHLDTSRPLPPEPTMIGR